MAFEVEYREIKPSKIPPNYSAICIKPTPPKLSIVRKPKPDTSYLESWKYD